MRIIVKQQVMLFNSCPALLRGNAALVKHEEYIHDVMLCRLQDFMGGRRYKQVC